MAIDLPQKTKLHYSIIFDTNTFAFGNPFSSKVQSLIESYKDQENVEMRYLLPKVVAEEFKSKLPQKIKDAKAAYGSAIAEINSLMGAKLSNQKPFFTDEEILKAGDKVLKDFGVEILDTPSISLSTILKKAINHQPPFKSEGDAGLKDEIIAETVKAHAPGLSNTSKVVFVCHDELLRKYMKSICEEYKFEVYQSVEEFESELKLRLLLSTEEQKLAESLQEEAEKIFFQEEDKGVHREAWDKITRTFPTLFSNPRPYHFGSTLMQLRGIADNSVEWVPAGKATYEIFKPLFMGKKEPDIFIWESTIVYSQEFEKQITYKSMYVGDITSGTYTLKFAVMWSVKLGSNGQLDPTSAKVMQVDQVKMAAGFPYLPEYGYPSTPISGPTTLSGTVTSPLPSSLSSLSPSASASFSPLPSPENEEES